MFKECHPLVIVLDGIQVHGDQALINTLGDTLEARILPVIPTMYKCNAHIE